MKTENHNDETENTAPAGGKSWKEGLVTARELQTKQFKPVRIILPNLIPEGVTILAGKPKVGKSWLALDVCLAVADGERFVLGEMKPVHGNALYLPLEDNQRRLKKRINDIVQSGCAPELQLHTEWRRFDQGGLEDIEEWCNSVKSPRLIWIDTLAKLRPLARRNEPTYDGDYRAIEGLQKLAGKYSGLGIVLNHHLRKMSSEDDAFDDVSGTLGLTAAADTIIVVKRHAGMVKILVRGRDIEDGEFAAEFNGNTCRWRLVGEASEVFRSQERQAILAALQGAPPEGRSVADIKDATKRHDGTALKALLFKMKQEGVISSPRRGYYVLASSEASSSDDESVPEPTAAGTGVQAGKSMVNGGQQQPVDLSSNDNPLINRGFCEVDNPKSTSQRDLGGHTTQPPPSSTVDLLTLAPEATQPVDIANVSDTEKVNGPLLTSVDLLTKAPKGEGDHGPIPECLRRTPSGGLADDPLPAPSDRRPALSQERQGIIAALEGDGTAQVESPQGWIISDVDAARRADRYRAVRKERGELAANRGLRWELERYVSPNKLQRELERIRQLAGGNSH